MMLFNSTTVRCIACCGAAYLFLGFVFASNASAQEATPKVVRARATLTTASEASTGVQLITEYLHGIPLPVQLILANETHASSLAVERQARQELIDRAKEISVEQCEAVVTRWADISHRVDINYLEAARISGVSPEYGLLGPAVVPLPTGSIAPPSSVNLQFDFAGIDIADLKLICHRRWPKQPLDAAGLRRLALGLGAQLGAVARRQQADAARAGATKNTRAIARSGYLALRKTNPTLAKELLKKPTPELAMRAAKQMIKDQLVDAELFTPQNTSELAKRVADKTTTRLADELVNAAKESERSCPSGNCTPAMHTDIAEKAKEGAEALQKTLEAIKSSDEGLITLAKDAKEVAEAYLNVSKIIDSAREKADKAGLALLDKVRPVDSNSVTSSNVERFVTSGSLAGFGDLSPGEQLAAINHHPFFKLLSEEERESARESVRKSRKAFAVEVVKDMQIAGAYVQAAGTMVNAAAAIGLIDADQVESISQALSIASAGINIAQAAVAGYLTGDWLPTISAVSGLFGSFGGSGGGRPDRTAQKTLEALAAIQKQLKQLDAKIDSMRYAVLSRLDDVETRSITVNNLLVDSLYSNGASSCTSMLSDVTSGKLTNDGVLSFDQYSARQSWFKDQVRDSGYFRSCIAHLNTVMVVQRDTGVATIHTHDAWQLSRGPMKFNEEGLKPIRALADRIFSPSDSQCARQLFMASYVAPARFDAIPFDRLACDAKVSDANNNANKLTARFALTEALRNRIINQPIFSQKMVEAASAIIALAPLQVLQARVQTEREGGERLMAPAEILESYSLAPTSAPYQSIVSRLADVQENLSRAAVTESTYSGVFLAKSIARWLREVGFGHIPVSGAEAWALRDRIAEAERVLATLPSEQKADRWVQAGVKELAEKRLAAFGEAINGGGASVFGVHHDNTMLWDKLQTDLFRALDDDEYAKKINPSSQSREPQERINKARGEMDKQRSSIRVALVSNGAPVPYDRAKSAEMTEEQKTKWMRCEMTNGGLGDQHARALCVMEKNRFLSQNVATYLVLDSLAKGTASLASYAAAIESEEINTVQRVLPDLPLYFWKNAAGYPIWRIGLRQPWGELMFLNLPDAATVRAGAISYAPTMARLRAMRERIREELFLTALPVESGLRQEKTTANLTKSTAIFSSLKEPAESPDE